MKQETKKKIAAYFVIFVMILSTAGFALFFSSPSKTTKKTNTPSVNTENINPMNFTADFNATIKNKTNRFVVYGFTNQYDISKIDLYVKRIKNVSSVDSRFNINSNNQIASQYTYFADVSGYNLDLNTLETGLKDVNLLNNTIVYPYVLVNYENPITFFNKDLNITKTYDLGERDIYIISNPSSLIGDKIEIKLYATFIKNAPTKLTGEEIKNYSLEPKKISFISNFDFNYDKTIVELDGNVDLIDVNKYKDYNAKKYGPKLYLFSNDLNVYNLLLDLNQYKDINKNTFYTGTIFVKNIIDGNKTFDYNKEVFAQIPYKTNINKKQFFAISASIVRDKVVSVFATLQNDLIKNNINVKTQDNKGGN